MHCPKCEGKMSPTDASGIQTHTCAGCQGIWMSEKALAILLKLEGAALNMRSIILAAAGAASDEMKCAQCSDRHLKSILVEKTQLAGCENCGGVFFEEDQLKNMLPETHKAQKKISGESLAIDGVVAAIVGFFLGSAESFLFRYN